MSVRESIKMPGPIESQDRDLYINTPLQRCYSESPRSLRPLMNAQQRDDVLKYETVNVHVPFSANDKLASTPSFQQKAPSALDTDYALAYGDEEVAVNDVGNKISPSSQEVAHALAISPRATRPAPLWFRSTIAIILSAFVCGIVLSPYQTLLSALTLVNIVIVALLGFRLISKCAIASGAIRNNSLSWLHMRGFIFQRNKFPEYLCPTVNDLHKILPADSLPSDCTGSPRYTLRVPRLVHAIDSCYRSFTLIPAMLFHLCFDFMLMVTQLFTIFLGICEYIERYRKQVVSRLWFDNHKRGTIHPDRARELFLRSHAILILFPNSIIRQLEIMLRPIVYITGATIMPVKAKQFANALNQHIEFFWDSDYTSQSPLRDLYSSKTPISSATHLS